MAPIGVQFVEDVLHVVYRAGRPGRPAR